MPCLIPPHPSFPSLHSLCYFSFHKKLVKKSHLSQMLTCCADLLQGLSFACNLYLESFMQEPDAKSPLLSIVLSRILDRNLSFHLDHPNSSRGAGQLGNRTPTHSLVSWDGYQKKMHAHRNATILLLLPPLSFFCFIPSSYNHPCRAISSRRRIPSRQ